jgi:four helix bundle protein
MSRIERFEDIEAWQKARELTKEIYALTNEGPFARDFGLRDQIRRASVSILSNIAEGFERNSNKEFVQFLYIAKGSAGEVRAQLYVALDQAYIGQSTFNLLNKNAAEISRMVSGLIAYLNKSGFKGEKR